METLVNALNNFKSWVEKLPPIIAPIIGGVAYWLLFGSKKTGLAFGIDMSTPVNKRWAALCLLIATIITFAMVWRFFEKLIKQVIDSAANKNIDEENTKAFIDILKALTDNEWRLLLTPIQTKQNGIIINAVSRWQLAAANSLEAKGIIGNVGGMHHASHVAYGIHLHIWESLMKLDVMNNSEFSDLHKKIPVFSAKDQAESERQNFIM